MNNIINTFLNDKLVMECVSMKGSEVFLRNGTKLFDLTGGLTSHCIIGWGNEKVIEAIKIQLDKFTHCDYKTFIDPNREELADLILTQLKNCNEYGIYYAGNSGAEACEAALKISYQSHYESGNVEKKLVISSGEAYHGATSETISLGDRPNLEFYNPILPQNKIRVSEVNYTRNSLMGETEHDYSLRKLAELECLIEEHGAKNIAAYVGESIAGGLTGYVPKPKNYWSNVRKICSKNNIHLILDEVIAGTGSTGRYFAIDYDETFPDILFMGKTLSSGYVPVNALVVKKSILESIKKGTGRIQHSSTHQGHSLGIASALAAQKIILQLISNSNIELKGAKIFERVHQQLLKSKFFNGIYGRGYRFSVQYSCPSQDLFGRMLTKTMEEKWKIIIDGKWHRVTFSPMLTVAYSSLENCIDIFCKEFLDLEKNWEEVSKNFSETKIDPQKRY